MFELKILILISIVEKVGVNFESTRVFFLTLVFKLEGIYETTF